MSISKELDDTQRSIIGIHRRLFGESPSPMKLQKLCYYAQGYKLAEGQEQFPDELQAWQHGPVNYDLFLKYRDLKWMKIDEDIGDPSSKSDPFLMEVVSAYGRFDGAALSTMTHREDPWLKTRAGLQENEGSAKVISKKLIQDYFERMLKDDEDETDHGSRREESAASR